MHATPRYATHRACGRQLCGAALRARAFVRLQALLQHLLLGGAEGGGGGKAPATAVLSPAELREIVRHTDGYSGSDLTAVAREAAMGPLRELGAALATTPAERIRATNAADFRDALRRVRPSVAPDKVRSYERWNAEHGDVSA
jgi:hypothetical protein